MELRNELLCSYTTSIVLRFLLNFAVIFIDIKFKSSAYNIPYPPAQITHPNVCNTCVKAHPTLPVRDARDHVKA